jgi:PilZ domain
MEKRLPIAIVVHLARTHDHTAEGPEVTYTDNLSAHGACVISARPWKIGEIAEVTSLNDRITLHAKVVYCHRRGEGRYNIGLDFQDREVTWSPSTSYTSHHAGIYRELSGSRLVRSA